MVDGKRIDVLNSQFIYEMIDYRNGKEYKISLEKNNGNTGKYEITYVIKSQSPELNLKWYGWNPEKIPHQALNLWQIFCSLKYFAVNFLQ